MTRNIAGIKQVSLAVTSSLDSQKSRCKSAIRHRRTRMYTGRSVRSVTGTEFSLQHFICMQCRVEPVGDKV